jgi:hypothetical protein
MSWIQSLLSTRNMFVLSTSIINSKIILTYFAGGELSREELGVDVVRTRRWPHLGRLHDDLCDGGFDIERSTQHAKSQNLCMGRRSACPVSSCEAFSMLSVHRLPTDQRTRELSRRVANTITCDFNGITQQCRMVVPQ